MKMHEVATTRAVVHRATMASCGKGCWLATATCEEEFLLVQDSKAIGLHVLRKE